MSNQLYRQLKNVRMPTIERFDTQTGQIFDNKRLLKGYYSFTWPNGTPCILAELYLFDKSQTVSFSDKDGGTLGNYARNITHLVRYCFSKKVDFRDLKHSNIDELVHELCIETDVYNDRSRNNNTVKSIIATSINFLVWIQNNIATDRLIVGVDDVNSRHQIKLKTETYTTPKGHQTVHNVFPMKVPRSTTSPVTPISTPNITRLWDTLESTKGSYNVSNKLHALFNKKQQSDHLEYMHKRRELQLILLEATGLRPQELVTIPCKSNIDLLKRCQLAIPTLKRRDGKIRTIPIPRNIAMKIEIFINSHRKKLAQRLIDSGAVQSANEIDDVLYLNAENGKEVLPDAAYQDFRRLTVKAGIKQKNCQKMFRHRFITNMVKLHLIGFMDKNPLKTRHIVTDSDYRTILKKVSTFTGHKSPDSLMHYIDLAWEELDAFSYTYEVKELQDRLKNVFYITNELKGDLNTLSRKQLNKSTVEKLNLKLNEIQELATNFRG